MSEIALTTLILLMQNLAFVKHQLGLSKDNAEQNLVKLLIRCQKIYNARNDAIKIMKTIVELLYLTNRKS
jgi:hypothetical protein